MIITTLVDDVQTHLITYWTATPTLLIRDKSNKPETLYPNAVSVSIPMSKASPANFQNTKFIENNTIQLHFKCQSQAILDIWTAHAKALMIIKSISGGYWTYAGVHNFYENTKFCAVQLFKQVKFI